MVEVRLLRSFAVVAEEGSFTSAARRLHLSQPALSQQIKGLEHQLRAELFNRSVTPVRLTLAGEQLLRHAYRVIEAVADTEDAMLTLAEARGGRLRVGVVIGGFYDVLHPVLRDLAEAVPEARFPVRQLASADQLAAVRRHEVDVAIFRRTDEASADGLAQLPLRDDQLIAVLPEGHAALRPDGSVRLADLAGERFVTFRRAWMPLTYDLCLAACRAAGFTPAITRHCEDPLSLAFAVSGGGVALTGAGMAGRYPGLVYAPVVPRTSIADVSLVWLPGNDNPLLPVFRERVVRHCGDPHRYWSGQTGM